jgi:uncharacterized lipoprotein YddW (UPF0748 family)
LTIRRKYKEKLSLQAWEEEVMKKKFKMLSITIFVSIISFTALNAKLREKITPKTEHIKTVVMANEVKKYYEDPLYKFETSTPITIKGEQLLIPTYFEATKEQFRGTWVSTVFNLDFPKCNTPEEFKTNYINILNRLSELNQNAVVFQVRPMLDALYPSNINPWSEYLSGKQGEKPEGFGDFDPLAWAISETHKQGMEFHAWFNPYRVTNSATDKRSKEDKLNELAPNNFARLNPHLVYEYNNKLYLEPGRQEVVTHLQDTILEVITNYDVDAIHFDDYFYPTSELNTDSKTFENYNRGISNIKAWRKDNINMLIKGIHSTIQTHNKNNKTSVQFGVSPFGIWGHAANTNGVGSNTPTTSGSSEVAYVDSREWVKEGIIDYLAPQIYWSFGNKAAPYGELIDWWDKQFEGITNSQLYIGHSPYKYIDNANDLDWKNPNEITNQLKFNQKYSNVKGSAMFSFRHLKYNDNQPVNAQYLRNLQNEHFNYPANVPAKPWLDFSETEPLQSLNVELTGNGTRLTWIDNNQDSRFYVIYRNEGNIDSTNPSHILKRVGVENGTNYIDLSVTGNGYYSYGVSVIDRAGNESQIIFN